MSFATTDIATVFVPVNRSLATTDKATVFVASVV
jgi:hypothetical protein